MVHLLATLRAGESAMLDGFALVLEVVGDEVTSRRVPPPPVLPALPMRPVRVLVKSALPLPVAPERAS